MIRVTREMLPFLLLGRELELNVDRRYVKGKMYAAGVHRKEICRVQVLKVDETDAGWTVTVRRLSGDQARLFTRSGGYVSAAVEANPDDPDVLRGADFHEPEPLSEQQLRDLTRYRPALDHAERAKPILELRDRIMAELDEALRTAPSRADRDKLRTMRHHASKLGQ